MELVYLVKKVRIMDWPTPLSLNHLVGLAEESRNFEAKCFCGLEVYHKLEPGRLHDGEVSRIGSLQNATGIDPSASIHVRDACPVAHQATSLSELTPLVDRWNPVSGLQSDNHLSLAVEERVSPNEKRID